MTAAIFVNLPVKNLNNSMEFFTGLGSRLIRSLQAGPPLA